MAISRLDGSESTVGEVLDGTFTDAYAVLQDGELVTEWYGPLGAPDRPHALMSVSKSVLGCVAAVLIDRGQLDPQAPVTAYVPELGASGYVGATVRHVLDMRSGVAFLEEYSNPQSDIRRLDEWIGWDGPPEHEPRGLYRFLATLRAEAPHGSRFLYRSAESDVLGWVSERAAGRPMAELISALVWAPMGAEHEARLLHDGQGTALHDGGLCATARDVARFGQMLLDGGAVPDGAGGTRRVVPPRWLRDGWAVDADVRSAFAASPAEAAFPGGWYRNQFWFRPGAHGDVLLGLGIHGGWCGNDLFPEALSEADRAVAISHVRKLGDRLAREGYKGFLEVDVLVDLDTGAVYLGELNPRISGVSSMTNVTAGAYADVPLFLFHLLEFMEVDYAIDVEEINERWRALAAVDVWSQLIMKEPGDTVERILAAPRTGAWRLADSGALGFEHVSNDWHDITTEDEAFFMRVYGPGEYRFHGADLGILVTKGRMQTAEGLTDRCRHYIEGIRSHYQSEPLPQPPAVKPVAYVK